VNGKRILVGGLAAGLVMAVLDSVTNGVNVEAGRTSDA
jgi:hypothetical protein